MKRESVITIFGANGMVGNHLIEQALETDHKLRPFVRDASKFKHTDKENVEVIQGDAFNVEDVEKAVEGVDVIVSCLGNTGKTTIMEKCYQNIIQAATKQDNPPRCIMISSIGLGGSSGFVKFLFSLMLIKEKIADFERADKLVREQTTVPYVLVRASGLLNTKGLGEYRVHDEPTIFWPRFISRADVAKFMLDCVDNKQWDNQAVILVGIK